MNSIIFTHVAATSFGANCNLDLALYRLSARLDAERDTLGRLLAQSNRRQVANVLDTLDQLHLNSDATDGDLRDLLEEASIYLEVLLETLRAFPRSCRLETAWGLPGQDTIDQHVRWSGARLEDILATLNYALTK